MRTSARSITIEAAPEHVFAFVADPANLPKWAIGFCKQIRQEDGSWIVTTERGDEIAIRIVTSAELGVVDSYMSPAPSVEIPPAIRVVPNGDGAEHVSRCSSRRQCPTSASSSRSTSSAASSSC